MIKCNECDRQFNSIVSHVRKHNLTPKQYLEKYPNSALMSDEQKEKISKKTKEAMQRPDVLKKYRNFIKNNDFSNRKPKYDRKDPEIKKRQYSEERNKKISEAKKQFWKNNKGKTVEELYGEEKGKLIRQIKSEQNSGSNNPAYNKIYKNVGRARGYYKQFFFRSLWEYSYIKFLESSGYDLQDIQYEKISIKFNFKETERTYRPDFYITKERKLIEIKSKWHLKNDNLLIESKKEAAEKWCLENNSTYHILTEEDFPILKYSDLQKDPDVNTKENNGCLERKNLKT